MCQSFIPESATHNFKQSMREVNYQQQTPEIWQEDQLIYVGGQNGPFRDNYMAHYRGWTIVVAFDSIDENWCTQAVHSLCYTISQYMQANKDNVRSIGIPDWFESVNEAYIAIKLKIEQLAE